MTKLDEETVLLNLNNGQYYHLNATASLLWLELTDEKSKADLTIFMHECFELENNEQDDPIEAELNDFINELHSVGLLVEK